MTENFGLKLTSENCQRLLITTDLFTVVMTKTASRGQTEVEEREWSKCSLGHSKLRACFHAFAMCYRCKFLLLFSTCSDSMCMRLWLLQIRHFMPTFV